MSFVKYTFSYATAKGLTAKRATDVQSTWLDLTLEFNQQREGLPSTKYYEIISEQVPQLFVVKLDQNIWYYDGNR